MPQSADYERAKHRLIRYLTLREAAANSVMIGGLDEAFRKEILDAAKQVAVSACVMDGEDPICAAELAHAAYSIIFVQGLVFESEKEVEQASAILDIANGVLCKGGQGEVDLDEDRESE